ncbi:MAG: hypothetical protein Q9227_009536, partial [Pyrenula ochraceoflavens]
TPELDAYYPYLPDFEPQLDQSILQLTTNFRTPTSMAPVGPTSTVNPQGTITLPISTTGFPGATQDQTISATEEAIQDRQPEAVASEAPRTQDIPSSIYKPSLRGGYSAVAKVLQAKPSRKSRHG